MTALYVLAGMIVLLGSIAPDLLLSGAYVQPAKLAALLALTALCLIVKKWRALWRFALVLFTINASFWMTAAIRSASWWNALFIRAGFFCDIAASVAVKVAGIVPVAIALLLLLKTPAHAYLSPGNLNIKADAIFWLGIKGDRVRWGKLAMLSGLCIMLGTVLLSIITTTGFRVPSGADRLLTHLPLILLLAIVNSFCEGLVFRCAIMGPIKGVFGKHFVLLLPAVYFGIAHSQGIPGGILGAAMSGILGYYMSLSMYETDGFVSAWIIHFMQDVAVFSTLALLG